MKKKKDYPRLSNGEIDYSKVDAGNCFRDFPKIYSTVEDIEEFILHKNCYYPVLMNLLKLRKENKLNLTPTEDAFYFENLFDYIYDVYRIPTEETYKKVAEWLQHIEYSLVFSGLSYVKCNSYESVRSNWEAKVRLAEFAKESGIKNTKFDLKEINCFIDIGENNDFYNRKDPKLIESFWIKCDKCVIQPIIKGDEAYARVHVYPERVYICGCDDSSYTLFTKTKKEAKEFALYLKCAAPVWNFRYTNIIHHKLEFTN
jgi:hypothetical protein